MYRHAIAVVFLLVLLNAAHSAQGQNPASDPAAISLAKKSMMALTGPAAVQDVTLRANVISILGSDYQTGTGILRARGLAQSRVDLNMSGGSRSEVRTLSNVGLSGASRTNGGQVRSYATHNCSTDAVWFFPAFSTLAQFANSNYIFQYLGQAQHGGVNTEHIRTVQVLPTGTQATRATTLAQHLSTEDMYLDPNTFLPLAIAFQVHPDQDASTDIPAEVDFANYTAIGGVPVPLHIQRQLNGGVVLDLTVTSATFDTGLIASTFTLP